MTTPSRDRLPGVHESFNIQADSATYEIEDRAVDPEGRIEAAMHAVADWAGRDVLDLGAGTGHQVPASRRGCGARPGVANATRTWSRGSGATTGSP